MSELVRQVTVNLEISIADGAYWPQDVTNEVLADDRDPWKDDASFLVALLRKSLAEVLGINCETATVHYGWKRNYPDMEEWF